jgi:hypothetical protein
MPTTRARRHSAASSSSTRGSAATARCVRHVPRRRAGLPGREATRRRRRHDGASHDADRGNGHSPWLFWDGRCDSQWAQALGPLESAVEHGGSRTQYAHVVAEQYPRRVRSGVRALPDTDRICRGEPVRCLTPPGALVAAYARGSSRRDLARVREHWQGDRRLRATHRARRIPRRSLRRRGAGGRRSHAREHPNE